MWHGVSVAEAKFRPGSWTWTGVIKWKPFYRDQRFGNLEGFFLRRIFALLGSREYNDILGRSLQKEFWIKERKMHTEWHDVLNFFFHGPMDIILRIMRIDCEFQSTFWVAAYCMQCHQKVTCCTAGTGESRSLKEASIRHRNQVLGQQLAEAKELVVMALSFSFFFFFFSVMMMMMMETIEQNNSPVVLQCLVWIEDPALAAIVVSTVTGF